jgi:hypothetical protein
MEEDALIFPSDIAGEGEALKDRVCDTIDSLCVHLQEKTKGRGMAVLSNLIDIAANVNPPRLTNSAGLDFDEQAIVDLVGIRIEEGLTSIEEEFIRDEQHQAANELDDKRLSEEIAPKSDKGKQPIQDTTPPDSPIRNQMEFGTSSRSLDPEIREILDLQQAQIASLTESEQRTQAQIATLIESYQKKEKTMAHILNMILLAHILVKSKYVLNA